MPDQTPAVSSALVAAATVLIGFSAMTASAADTGVIFGTIELADDQSITGTMRWGGQESHWVHHFNGDKAEPFDLDSLSREDRQQVEANLPGPRFEVNGHVIELVRWLGRSELQRQAFAVEFGQIRELKPDGERVTLTLVDGSTIEADGGSDDIGAQVDVMTLAGDIRNVDWDDIRRVRFHAPDQPGSPQFPPYLYGQVKTRDTTYTGFIDWDRDERYPDEELDGEVNGEDRAVTFAAIRSIANQGESSLVTLTDGTELSMSGTNDVNSENRGIIVHTTDTGWVLIPWSTFESVRFQPHPPGLPTYTELGSSEPIKARVKTRSEELTGNLAFDLDQRSRGEMLRGKLESGEQFKIPWRLIERLSPNSDNTCTVTLRSGRALKLGRNPDVTQANAGVAIFDPAGSNSRYVTWDQVTEIQTIDGR